VVAVERGEELFTRFAPEFRFEEQDAVYVCGDQQGIERCQPLFGS
jgi:K+/H+ antiporter YhaU regulatory subunit KhtT